MADYEYIGDGSPDGTVIGRTSTEKIGFYGKVPVVRRPYTSSVHNTDAVASSSTFPAAQLAILKEVMNTMIALGWWATA